ncbi:Hsp20/alpha crystallin family protein [Comamonas composti]|uniref:Hsp20/alpha crystallin family protein n=1 Tax=Comamonas composti TaxID=408558 RepID=UPI0003F88356|nr:Hsp20/alpha crystallin family protein [Comamonas composti]
MIFTPVLRRNAFTPRAADLSLQRFLQDTLGHTAAPANVQVQRDEKATTLQTDLPGLAREQLQISIEGSVVRVSSVEDAARQVQRAWELDHEIDAAQSRAKLEHGVLTLTLARKAPESKATTLVVE